MDDTSIDPRDAISAAVRGLDENLGEYRDDWPHWLFSVAENLELALSTLDQSNRK